MEPGDPRKGGGGSRNDNNNNNMNNKDSPNAEDSAKQEPTLKDMADSNNQKRSNQTRCCPRNQQKKDSPNAEDSAKQEPTFQDTADSNNNQNRSNQTRRHPRNQQKKQNTWLVDDQEEDAEEDAIDMADSNNQKRSNPTRQHPRNQQKKDSPNAEDSAKQEPTFQDMADSNNNLKRSNQTRGHPRNQPKKQNTWLVEDQEEDAEEDAIGTLQPRRKWRRQRFRQLQTRRHDEKGAVIQRSTPTLGRKDRRHRPPVTKIPAADDGEDDPEEIAPLSQNVVRLWNQPKRRMARLERMEHRQNHRHQQQQSVDEVVELYSSDNEDDIHDDDDETARPGVVAIAGPGGGRHPPRGDSYTIVYDTNTEDANQMTAAAVTPLDANLVPSRDEVIQQRLQDLTVDALHVIAVPETSNEDDPTNNSSRSSNRPIRHTLALLVGGACTVLVITVLTIVGLYLGGILKMTSSTPSSSPSSSSSSFSPSPTSKEVDEETALELAIEFFSKVSSKDVLLDESTPQRKAMNWLLYDDPMRQQWFFNQNMKGDTTEVDKDESSVSQSSLSLLLERYILVLLYWNNNGPNWLSEPYTQATVGDDFRFSTNDWLSTNTSICTWSHVSCNDQGAVVALDFLDSNLTGTIPDEITHLTLLQSLDFAWNFLSGTFPTSSTFFFLEDLDCSWNSLIGTLPSFVSARNLKQLRFYGCEFTGTIPSHYWASTTLEMLALSFNYVTGTIPEFSKVHGSKLQGLWLEGMMLSGSISESIDKLTQLRHLSLTGTEVTGTIPTTIGRLEDLRYLWLNSCSLIGTIPTELGQLTRLRGLDLVENEQLHGTIPTELSKLRDLSQLFLSSTSLTGPIPSELGALDAYEIFLRGTALTGTVPLELSKIPGFLVVTNTSLAYNAFDAFCDAPAGVALSVEADCLGSPPKVDCSCCTRCFDDEVFETNMEARCNIFAASHFTHERGHYYDQTVDTVCECHDVGYYLECLDNNPCTSCNRDETVCAISTGYEFEFDYDGFVIHRQFSYQYVTGRNDSIHVLHSPLVVQLNDENDTACYLVNTVCSKLDPSTISWGYNVVCDDMQDGHVDICDEKQDSGVLTMFEWQDPFARSGCEPIWKFALSESDFILSQFFGG